MANIPRGLEALLGKKPAGGSESISYIATAQLKANPFQPRSSFPAESLAELAQSIKTSGILQPIVITERSGEYVVVAGERRLRAAEMAGLKEVPAVIRATSDKDMLILALLENLHRDDLNILEEAAAYDRLGTEFELSQAALADLVSKSRSHVANTLRLLKLPASVRDMLAQGLLSTMHARSLLSLKDTRLQEALAIRAVKEKLTVRELNALVEQLAQPRQRARRSTRSPGPYSALAAELTGKLGRRVWIQAYGKEGKEKGRLSLEFFSPADFAALQEALVKHLKPT
ncbi:MAG: ParB/RepB/Spo0J family partition protein [Planctomycetes bacterium]|nr:ParB/RepB/Spo0J family partition protein [Planctomycetota bacterium]